MIDEKTLTARHELLGRIYLLEELTLAQLQKWEALKDEIEAQKGAVENEFRIFMKPATAAKLLSVILLDEEGGEVQFSVEEASRLKESQLGMVLQDFFDLNPGLTGLLTILLAATLRNLGGETAAAVGKAANSGSTSSTEPAEDVSQSGRPC